MSRAQAKQAIDLLLTELDEHAREVGSGTIALALSRLRAPRATAEQKRAAWAAIAKDLAQDIFERGGDVRPEGEPRLLLGIAVQLEAIGGAR